MLVTAETKSVPLVYELARRMGKPWVILRKQYKPYMGETVTAETVSITTGHPQTLHLDEKDRPLVEGKSVVLVDDVISTGSTLDGMRAVVREAGGRVVAEAAVFTEGDADQVEGIVSLGHLPLFPRLSRAWDAPGITRIRLRRCEPAHRSEASRRSRTSRCWASSVAVPASVSRSSSAARRRCGSRERNPVATSCSSRAD